MYLPEILLALLCLLNGSCNGHSIGPGTPDSYLRRFEPVFYDNHDLLKEHLRRRRSNDLEENDINLEFYSHGRNFRLNLKEDTELFHPDVIIENSAGPIKYDTRKVLSGTIKDEPESSVHGILTDNGVFDGYLSTANGHEFYSEPASAQEYPAIMYRPEDVEWDRSPHECESQKLWEKKLKAFPNHAIKVSTGNNATSEIRAKRAARWGLIDQRKRTCTLYLQADHRFYERFGSEEASIDVMTKHIQRVNDIYKVTDFDGDGKPDGISFMIKRVKVHTSQDPEYRYHGKFQVVNFLEAFSEGDYDSFCLAYMFTFRDFEGGTLGLAWTADTKNSGGVCEKRGHFRGGSKSLNTGIITLLNYGKVVPPSVSYVTLAHEIGHNFGSHHDPETDPVCVPGGEDGNYIMFARATAGDRRNNKKFSACSLKSILPVLVAKAVNPFGCFTEPQVAICGNGVVEKGEECDCGWEDDCRESCCFPQRLRPSPFEPPCTLRPFKFCSPSQGPCCNNNCTVKIGNKCRDDNGCRDAASCDGLSPFCPLSRSKPNKTVCNKDSVCFMGECTGSICLAYGLESCQCNPRAGEPSKKFCDLCCKVPGEGNPCLSSFQLNEPGNDVPDSYAKPGTPCKNYTGYCDAYQNCREIDPSGPLATLRKLLLADEGLAFLADWIDNHWYAVLVSVVVLIIALIATAHACGKRANKARLRKLTVMHSNVEAIQIQQTYLESTGNHIVHPVPGRKKIPFRKKVFRRRAKSSRNMRVKGVRTSDNGCLSRSSSKFGSYLWRKRHRSTRGRRNQRLKSPEEEMPGSSQQSPRSEDAAAVTNMVNLTSLAGENSNQSPSTSSTVHVIEHITPDNKNPSKKPGTTKLYPDLNV